MGWWPVGARTEGSLGKRFGGRGPKSRFVVFPKASRVRLCSDGFVCFCSCSCSFALVLLLVLLIYLGMEEVPKRGQQNLDRDRIIAGVCLHASDEKSVFIMMIDHCLGNSTMSFAVFPYLGKRHRVLAISSVGPPKPFEFFM